MVDYQGKRVVIIGLGITGLSCVDYFLTKDIVPKVIDTRPIPPGIEKLDPRVQYHAGSMNLQWMLAADLIIISPGIALSMPELVASAAHDVEIIGDIELFCREVNQLKNKKIVAITGANGKTTVTSLMGEILIAAGLNVGIGGNIGTPALSLLNQGHDYFVLELSSFQLETTYSLHATVATILNISEDHMDRYPQGLMEYVAAKQRIYLGAQCCVINHDDSLTYPQNITDITRCVEFGIQKGTYHLDPLMTSLVVQNEPILLTTAVRLFGIHNYLNALVALAIADELAIPRVVTLDIITRFKGLPHRFELVYEHNGIKWINDSKATNVGSTEAALKSVICKGKLFLLLGGDGKSADFSSLKPYLDNHDVTIYCFGRDKYQLSLLRPDRSMVMITMKDAIQDIVKKIQPNDIVLLSPACASLDQFKNYIERGQQFTALAKELG